MTTVLIVDDQQLLRRGLRLLLETVADVADIEVVGESADGREALAVLPRLRPDVVLTDARMPGMGGVDLVRACREHHPGLPVVVLTTFDDEALVRDAMASGAAGFLLRTPPESLADAIRAVAAGGLVIDPRVARIAMGSPRADRQPPTAEPVRPDPLAILTRAERLVAVEVATGATNAEIAASLVLAEGTVKNYVSVLMRKLRARDRTALALRLSRDLRPDPDDG